MKEMAHNSSASTLQKENIFNIFSRISSLMMRVEDEATFMHTALADIGQTLGVSRVYTFISKGAVWANNYEWAAPGISSEIDHLQHIDITTMPEDSMLPQIAKGKTFVIEDVSRIEDRQLRGMLSSQGIVAMVSFPLFYKSKVVGFFGFDQCEHVPQWTKATLDAVVALGSFMNAANAYFMGKRIIQQKRKQLQNIFDSMPMPIYVSDRENYTVLFCNKVIHDNFDTSNLAEKKCYKIFQNMDAPCDFCTNSFLKAGEQSYVWHHHNALINADYKVIDSLVTWEEKEEVRFSIAMDITESLRLQREQVLEREAHFAKEHFIASMSHELRTPLNGIIGLTHLATKANTDPQVADYLKKITFSSQNLLGVINETLDASAIEEGKITLESAPFSVSDVLYGAQALLQSEVDKKGITLDVVLDATIPVIMMGDAQRLSQVVLNLSSNAVKFTKEGKVTLALHSCEAPEGIVLPKVLWMRLDVSDTGIGITQEQSDRLFKEFSQVDSSTSRKFGGTGLGLVITQKFVELMGGYISVHSEVGKGTTFSCIFPLVQYDDRKHESKHTPQGVQDIMPLQAMDMTGIHVLLVEDNEINTLIASEVLESFGCTVTCVMNGQEALEILEKESFQIVLMDIQMPVMDGLQATRILRTNRRFDNLPIVAMSAHAMVQDFTKSRNAGMQGHVPKPFVPEELRKILYTFVSQDFHFSPNTN